MTRRVFLRGLLCATPALILADSLWIEPRWVATRRVNLAQGIPRHRFVFFTDLHHKGDRKFLDSVVRSINALSPEFVCFGGDLVEDSRHLADALEGLQRIQAPLYGVPGNHDYWSHADFDVIGRAFAATGGRWLINEVVEAAGGRVQIAGATCMKPPQFDLREGMPSVALIHYPL